MITQYHELKDDIPPFKYATLDDIEARIEWTTALAAIDTETTGFLGGTHRIIEVGQAVAELRFMHALTDHMRPKQCVELTQQRFNPQRPIDPGASKVSGISDQDLVKEPLLNEHWLRCAGAQHKCPVLMWNAPFDAHFIAAEFLRAGAVWELNDFVRRDIIDVKVLANQMFPDAPRKLSAFASYAGIPFHTERLHGALYDAMLTASVFAWLYEKMFGGRPQ